MRKFLISLNVVIFATALVLAGFWVSKRGESGNQSALIDNSLVSRFETPTEKYQTPKELFQITREKSYFATTLPESKELWYYNPENGEIRSTALDGMPTSSSLVSKIQPNATGISWAANKTLVARYNSESIFYNLNNGFSKKYDPGIKNPIISKSGDKIIFTSFNPKTKSGFITIADPNAEGSKNLMPTRFENWQITWLSDGILALADSQDLTSIFAIDLEGKNFESLLNSKKDLQLAWSPDGQRAFYSFSDEFANGQIVLNTIELSTKTENSLGLEIPASRCAWSIDSKNIICAYLNKFVLIDTRAKVVAPKDLVEISALFTGGSGAVSDLLLTSTEDRLIFKNLQNGKLYGVYLGN